MDWIDIGPDDQTLRIEFLEGVVDGLHHIDIDEDDESIQVTVFVGLDPEVHGGAYALVGFHSVGDGQDEPSGRESACQRRLGE